MENRGGGGGGQPAEKSREPEPCHLRTALSVAGWPQADQSRGLSASERMLEGLLSGRQTSPSKDLTWKRSPMGEQPPALKYHW